MQPVAPAPVPSKGLFSRACSYSPLSSARANKAWIFVRWTMNRNNFWKGFAAGKRHAGPRDYELRAAAEDFLARSRALARAAGSPCETCIARPESRPGTFWHSKWKYGRYRDVWH